MPSLRRRFGWWSILVRAGAAASPALPLIGCASSAPPPPTTETPFEGPAVTIDSSGPEHVAVVEAPTPGWQVTVARVMPAYGHRAAYLQMRRPYPGAMYAQVIVTQRVALGVASTEPVRVYARAMNFEDARSSEAPFAFAAGSEKQQATPE